MAEKKVRLVRIPYRSIRPDEVFNIISILYDTINSIDESARILKIVSSRLSDAYTYITLLAQRFPLEDTKLLSEILRMYDRILIEITKYDPVKTSLSKIKNKIAFIYRRIRSYYRLITDTYAMLNVGFFTLLNYVYLGNISIPRDEYHSLSEYKEHLPELPAFEILEQILVPKEAIYLYEAFSLLVISRMIADKLLSVIYDLKSRFFELKTFFDNIAKRLVHERTTIRIIKKVSPEMLDYIRSTLLTYRNIRVYAKTFEILNKTDDIIKLSNKIKRIRDHIENLVDMILKCIVLIDELSSGKIGKEI